MTRRARHISSRTRHRLGRWFDFFAGRRSRPRGSRTSQSQTVGRTCLLEPLEDRRLLTDISGPIPDGSVWDDVTEPYHIIADATLAAGHTLTIEPGVEVISDHFEPLKIYGTVEADEVEFSGGTEISVEAGGRLDLANGTTMDGRFVRYKTGSFGDIADTTFSTAQLILLSGDVTLSNQNNTYSSDEPVSTLPSLVPEFHGSTFDAASDATIYVGGTTEGTANWIPMGSVNRYEIDGAITVAAGTSLTIESGLEVFTANGQSIKVLGSFAADGVDFTGRTLIRVEDGGRVDLSGASSVAGTSVEYKEGSLGDIADTTFSTAQLQLYSSSVTLRGQNNTFSNTEPVFTYPSLVPELFDNTFNSPDDPAIFIEGTTEGAALWKPIGNVQRYHVDSGMRVAAGTTLTIEPGVEVYSDTWVTIRVFGTFAADGVDFTGSTEMTAEAGGRLDLSGSSVAGNLVEYAADSLGSLADTTFTTAQLQLYSTDVTLLAQNNTFTGTEPVDAYPSVVPELFDSIFTAGAAATIYIQGKTEGVASWSPIGEVTRYYIHQDVTVMAGTTLTIQAGVEVSSRTDRDIRVNGTLTADGVDFTGDTLIWVRDGGRADLSGGTTVEGDELRYWDGSLGDVSDTTFTTAQLKLYSAGVSLRDQNNTFTGTEPASAYSSLVPELFGNTFNSVAPATIFVQRTTEGSAIWKPIGSVSRYELESGVRVAVGDTLIIEPGLEIFSPHNLDIQALGTLQAEGVDFTGETILLVPDGGRLDLSGGTTVAGEYVHYRWNSLGSIRDTTFTTAQLRLNSTAVSVRGQNNTFTSTAPAYTNPSIVPELYDNTFTAGAAAAISIHGETEGDVTWRPIGELNRYQLELSAGVRVGETLTIDPGTEVFTSGDVGMTVRGALVAAGAAFTGETNIGVWDRLDLHQCRVSGTRVEYRDGSTGKVRYTNLGLPVTIHSASTVSIKSSDFSDSTVIAEGPAGTTINLGGNYWGTVNPAEIEAKITHQVDDPSLPLVIFEPWLTQPPLAELVIVNDMTPDDCGFSATFNLPVDVEALNLYDCGHHLLGPADVTLVGSSSGPVTGNLLVADSGQRMTFVRSGGPLEPDTYTLWLRARAGGIVSNSGLFLDGNEDGTPGGDFVSTFTVADTNPVVVSLPDFMRGPGQPVDVPAIDDGIALRLSDTANVDLIDLTLTYDPALLTIVEVNKGPTVPADALLQVNSQTPGQLQLSLSATTPLPAGPLELVTLTADVPATATYGEIQILDFTSVRINDGAIPAAGDDALHVVGYLGDATGNGGYSGLDAQRVARVGVGLDSGFADWPRVNPLIVGDITGKDGLSGFDAQRIAREVVGLHSPEIPAIPQPQRLAIPSNRSRQTLDETDRSFAVPTGLTRVWEGEAPAEPHSGSASGSAGASPSRLPPPNITQPYVDRADLLTAVLDERDYVLGDGDEQDDRGKETGIRGVWDEGSLDDDISAHL